MKLNRYYNQIEAARYVGVTRQAVAARFGDRYTTVGKHGAKHQSRIPEPALIQWVSERHDAARKLLESGATISNRARKAAALLVAMPESERRP